MMGVVFSAPVLLAEDIRVTASLDKRTAQVGEEIRLTIRITGQNNLNLQAPRLPVIDGIESFYMKRASYITFVNGVSTSSAEFFYTLVPQRVGNFTLPSIEVQVGQQNFKTDPNTIEVLDGAGGRMVQPPAQPQPTTPAIPTMPRTAPQTIPQTAPQGQTSVAMSGSDDNIFVRAWTNRKTCYQNEQLLLVYSLYTRYDTRYEGFEKEPETSGFWIEEFAERTNEIERETVRENGKRYVKADVKKLALFPTAPGNYTIQPGSLKVSIREEPQGTNAFDEFFSDSFFSGGSFFARRQNRLLSPAPIQLVVKPLPEQGKPESFQGAVGSFRISASIDKSQVKQGEPVTLKVDIEGDGNIETINRPKVPVLTGFKTYDADTKSQLFKTGDVIGGKKSFEIVFIPKDAGNVFVPPLEFSYFDPKKEKYLVLQTPNFPLKVEKSEQSFQMPETLTGKEVFQKQVKLEAKDIHYIHEKISEPSLLSKGFYVFLKWLDLLLFVGLLALWVKDRQERLFSKDEAFRRRKLARSVASANMKKLKKIAHSSKSEDTADFFVELEKAMTQYIADKWNLSAFGVTRHDLEATLMEHFGSEDEHLKDVLGLYHLCDESRFGKGSIPQASKKMGLKIFQDTVNRIEGMKK